MEEVENAEYVARLKPLLSMRVEDPVDEELDLYPGLESTWTPRGGWWRKSYATLSLPAAHGHLSKDVWEIYPN